MISHLIIKWPTISSYPNLHQLNYEMPLFYANSGNIASLTFQPHCLSIRPAWSINLRAVPGLDSAANKPCEFCGTPGGGEVGSGRPLASGGGFFGHQRGWAGDVLALRQCRKTQALIP